MALQKDMIIGGQPFSYHKIKSIRIDAINLKASMEIGHYKDKAYRDENPNGNIQREIRTFGGDLAMIAQISQMTVLELFAFCYQKMKEPVMVQQVIDGIPQFEEDGTTPIMVDTNFYTDALDVLEV